MPNLSRSRRTKATPNSRWLRKEIWPLRSEDAMYYKWLQQHLICLRVQNAHSSPPDTLPPPLLRPGPMQPLPLHFGSPRSRKGGEAEAVSSSRTRCQGAEIDVYHGKKKKFEEYQRQFDAKSVVRTNMPRFLKCVSLRSFHYSWVSILNCFYRTYTQQVPLSYPEKDSLEVVMI